MQKSMNVDYEKMNTKAIEKFIQRQVDARDSKKKDEEDKSKKVGSGNNWQNKITKPITPRTLKMSKS